METYTPKQRLSSLNKTIDELKNDGITSQAIIRDYEYQHNELREEIKKEKVRLQNLAKLSLRKTLTPTETQSQQREVVRLIPCETLRDIEEYSQDHPDKIIECSDGIFQEVIYNVVVLWLPLFFLLMMIIESII